MSKRKLIWIEATRTLAMAGVILGHVNNFWYLSGGFEAWWSAVVSVAIRCVVPAFFMVSGFLLGRGLGSPQRSGGGLGWWRRKLDGLIVPFLAWNLIYMVWFWVFQGRPIWSGLTVWNLATGYDHLYFVFVLLQFFVLWALVRDHLNEGRLRSILIWSAILSGLFYLVSDALLWWTGPDAHFFEWTFGKVFVGWGLFFWWGVWLGHRPELLGHFSRRLGAMGLVTLLSLAAYLAENWWQLKTFGHSSRDFFLLTGLPFHFLGATFLLAGLEGLGRTKVGQWVVDELAPAGVDTFGIYLCHVAVLVGLAAAWGGLGLPGAAWLKLPVLVGLTWLVSQGLVRVCRLPSFQVVNRVLFGARG